MFADRITHDKANSKSVSVRSVAAVVPTVSVCSCLSVLCAVLAVVRSSTATV